MRHFSAFLRQLRNFKDSASGLEAEVHYARLDAVLNTLGVVQQSLSYRDLGKALGVFSAKLGAMLSRRMEDDHANGEPLSSALIVNRNTGISSPGFFDLARSMGYQFADPEQFWRDQCERTFDRFNEATVSMTLNTGLTDDEEEKVERADAAIAGALIEAGITDRAVWSSESFRGKRLVRLRTASRVILDLTEAEMAKLSAESLVARLKDELAS
jgi:hypothetical protein